MHEDLKCGVTWNWKSLNAESWSVWSAGQVGGCERRSVLTNEFMKEPATHARLLLPNWAMWVSLWTGLAVMWFYCGKVFRLWKEKDIVFLLSTHTTLKTSLLASKCVDFFPLHGPILQQQQFNSILTLSTGVSIRFHGLRCSVPKTASTSNTSHKQQVPSIPTLLFDLAINWGCSQPPPQVR